MDEDVRDKILLFSCSRAGKLRRTRRAFGGASFAKLPGFLHYVDTWPLPKGIADSRYGFKTFQHPEVLEALQGYSPETRLLDLIDDVIFDASNRKEFEGHGRAVGARVAEFQFRFCHRCLAQIFFRSRDLLGPIAERSSRAVHFQTDMWTDDLDHHKTQNRRIVLMQTKGTPPRFKFKVGRVNASVWQNGEHWNTTFTVSYKDDKDKWSETNSFSRNDLPGAVQRRAVRCRA